MSFRVGDRVRINADVDCPPQLRGEVGEIVAISSEGDRHPISVALDTLGAPYNRRVFSPGELAPEARDFESSLDAILSEVRELMIERHKKYGPGNILRHGEMGVVVRLGDKYERLDHSREVDFSDEAIDDTASDIIGYGLIFKMLRAGQWPGQKQQASSAPE